MNIIGCLDTATSGSYKINGKETIELSKDQLSDLRSQNSALFSNAITYCRA